MKNTINIRELKQEFKDLLNSDPDFNYKETELNEWLSDIGVFTCDKFKNYLESGYGTWLNTEDFTPKENEKLSKEASRYDFLCEACYQNLLIK